LDEGAQQQESEGAQAYLQILGWYLFFLQLFFRGEGFLSHFSARCSFRIEDEDLHIGF